MNFELTEERQMLQDTLRRFLRTCYTTEFRNGVIASDQGYSPKIWTDLAELGVIGALFNEDQGGFGGTGFDIATVFEELGRAGVVEPFLETGLLAGRLLNQQDMIDQIIAGQLQLAFAHAEPNSRYDLNDVSTLATMLANKIVLNGRKAVVANAEAADYLIISARESGDDISFFLVPRDTKGMKLQGYPMTDGGRAAEVILDDVTIDVTSRIGIPGQALNQIETTIAAATVALCAEALGLMETAIQLTIDYLGTRKQFGKPIGSFQALQHRMADMLIELEQVRSIVILAAGHLETAPNIRDRYVSAAKNLIGRVGRLVAEESIQMHGGIAMTEEYELAHIAKRIIMIDHKLGDTDYHLERFIALSA
ncbi:acyl-CoA dehydrogenase family protein [Parasulfitobacter algicola]|uniref:Acyl-CoA dehydrogenase family protein n=1 Tax=Parasulfitobacter algicola TaxID=2614809 RepID=A0ABX2IX17_9RHOB|nr:acyl-CoA dehydrogenase [Sulfitobacter algicola]NSX54999.1 acyl-CoA dehydrogenase family protein [Sulfitobacter algicola]